MMEKLTFIGAFWRREVRYNFFTASKHSDLSQSDCTHLVLFNSATHNSFMTHYFDDSTTETNTIQDVRSWLAYMPTPFESTTWSSNSRTTNTRDTPTTTYVTAEEPSIEQPSVATNCSRNVLLAEVSKLFTNDISITQLIDKCLTKVKLHTMCLVGDLYCRTCSIC